MGIFFTIISLSKRFKTIYFVKRDSLIFLLCFFIPLLVVIVFKSNLYDGWRQLYFIYPAFILLALIGLFSFYNLIKNKLKNKTYKIFSTIFIIILVTNFSNVAYFMIKNHPFQNVYFNEILQGNMTSVKNNFELDYWGLSYRKALEYILKEDSKQKIDILVANAPGYFNRDILTFDQKKRLNYVEKISDAKYFLSEYRWHKDEYNYADEFYSVKVNGIKIMVVYKLK